MIRKYAMITNYRKINTEGFRFMGLMSDNDKPAMMFVTDNAEWLFPLETALDVYVCNVFMVRLNLGLDFNLDVVFKNYRQYGELIERCGVLLEKQQRGDYVNAQANCG